MLFSESFGFLLRDVQLLLQALDERNLQERKVNCWELLRKAKEKCWKERIDVLPVLGNFFQCCLATKERTRPSKTKVLRPDVQAKSARTEAVIL